MMLTWIGSAVVGNESIEISSDHALPARLSQTRSRSRPV
jgi:hypothetical protein